MKMKEKTVALKNGAKVTIKTASPDEADALLGWLQTVCGETDYLASTQKEASAIDKKQEQEFIVGHEKSKKNIFLAAYSGKEIIATCSVEAVSAYERESHRAKLGVAVKRDFWNLGVASELLSTAIDFAGKVGYEQIELDVVPDNVNAILLYNKFGFEPVGSFPRAVKADGNYRDVIRFVKYLGN